MIVDVIGNPTESGLMMIEDKEVCVADSSQPAGIYSMNAGSQLEYIV